MPTPNCKQFVSTVTAIPNHRGEPEMVVSTSTPDREGDRIIPGGVDISNFQRNPGLLWAHDYNAIPIGTVTALDQTRDGWRARWRWNETDEFAQRVKQAWENGFVRAASVGFLPRRAVPNDYGGYDHVASELLEISLVPVPANPEAVRQLKHLGLYGSKGEASDANDVLELVEEKALFEWAGDQGELARLITSIVGETFLEEMRAEVGRAIDRHRGRVE